MELILPKQFHPDLWLTIRISFIDQNFFDYLNPNDYLIKTDKFVKQYNHLTLLNKTKAIKYIDFEYRIEFSKKFLWILINGDEDGTVIELDENNLEQLY